MRGNRLWLLTVILALILPLLACMAESTPEVVQVTPSKAMSTPIPPVAISDTPTAEALAGPLPSILHRIDLGVPADNGYKPVSLAVDEATGLAYVLNEESDRSLQGIISVVALDQSQVVKTIPLDRVGPGKLFFVGALLYLVASDEATLALDPDTGQSLATLPSARAAAPDGKGNLILADAEGLRVVDAASAQVTEEIPLVFPGEIESLAADGETDRIYVATWSQLLIFDGQGGTIATHDLEGQGGHALASDQNNHRLYIADAGQVRGFNGRTGASLDLPTVRLGPEGSVPAVRGLVVDGEAGRLYVLHLFHEEWYGSGRVEVVDLESGQVLGGSTFPMGYGSGLALDRGGNRLLLANRAYDAVRIFQANPLEPTRRISVGVTLMDAVLDPQAERLYVSDNAGQVHVFDTEGNAESTAVAGGRYLALDLTRHRLYAGDYETEVVALDSLSLEAIGRVPQPGKPVVNPGSGEVYIINHSVYVADPESLTVTGDLYPELGKPYVECPSCYYTIVTDLAVDPKGQEMYPVTYTPWPGKPSDVIRVAVDAQTDRVYHMLLKGGYYRYGIVSLHEDMAALNAGEPPKAWLDGLAGEIAVDGRAGRLYLAWETRLLVLDAETLGLIGRLDDGYLSIAAVDSQAGRLYALDGDQLVVLATSGSWPATYPSETVAALTGEVREIYPSPAYAADRTVFVVTDDVYRSDDDGESWVRLAGGVLEEYSVSFNLAFSPDFATDKTVFAFRSSYGQSLGEGVYRSTDRGDTWQPVWNGLNHLRVYDVVLSSDYGADGTVLAYARYEQPTPPESGYSVFRSADRGLSWTLEMTRSEIGNLPSPEELLPPGPASQLVRFRDNCTYDSDGQRVCYVERTADGGRTWEEILVIHEPSLHTALPSPGFDEDKTIYGLSDYDLFRSRDGGNTWEHWSDERLGGRDFERRLTVMAIAPLPDQDRHQIFIGTAASEFWSLDPTALTWAPMLPPTPTVMPSPTATAVPTFTPSATETPMTTPPAGFYRPEGVFEELWGADGELRQALGWAAAPQATSIATAFQPFEGGAMIWREDARLIYALFNDGSWMVFDDTWMAGEPEEDPTIVPPEGLLQPIRGFGKVWRNNADVRAGLGWALEGEAGYTSPVQTFERGVLIQIEEATYALVLTGGRPAIWYRR